MNHKVLSVFLLCTVLMPLPALAQSSDNAQTMDRLDHIEHDLMLLQRQISRGGVPAASGDAGLPAGGSADLEVRLTAIEDQLRELRGKIEENEFQVKKVSEALDKLQKDTEFRFGELAGAAPAKTGEKNPVETPPAKTDEKPGATTGGDGILRLPDNPDNAGTPREHYDYAFRLLNQTQYPEAAAAFDAFTKKYPKDPLVGNAFYWEGETYYIRRDYVNAADYFRQGFEALPDGPKAADNLLKLSMSLDALSRDKEACVVLQQIVTKFKKNSTSVAEKASQEQKRIGCK